MNWYEIKPVVDLITYGKNSEPNIFFYKVTDSSYSETQHICHFLSNLIYKRKKKKEIKEEKGGFKRESTGT